MCWQRLGGRLIPGVVVFSLLGYLGQGSYNAIDNWQIEQANTPSKPIIQRIANSKWIPLKSLSDDDYRGLLSEKLLSIEAEMALLDEDRRTWKIQAPCIWSRTTQNWIAVMQRTDHYFLPSKRWSSVEMAIQLHVGSKPNEYPRLLLLKGSHPWRLFTKHEH